MHNGSGGTEKYWRSYYNAPNDFNQRGRRSSSDYHQQEAQSFDKPVMDRLNDHHSKYVDGALGGGLSGLTFMDNTTSWKRQGYGYEKGMADAASVIESLQRDGNGNIVESIKIITHSMGAAYGKGYAKALLDYAEKKGISGVKIAFEADFAPFNPDKQKALKKNNMGSTFQFSHSADGIAGNEPMPGAVNMDTKNDSGQRHDILDFMNQVAKLPAGEYKVVDGKIVPK